MTRPELEFDLLDRKSPETKEAFGLGLEVIIGWQDSIHGAESSRRFSRSQAIMGGSYAVAGARMFFVPNLLDAPSPKARLYQIEGSVPVAEISVRKPIEVVSYDLAPGGENGIGVATLKSFDLKVPGADYGKVDFDLSHHHRLAVVPSDPEQTTN